MNDGKHCYLPQSLLSNLLYELPYLTEQVGVLSPDIPFLFDHLNPLCNLTYKPRILQNLPYPNIATQLRSQITAAASFTWFMLKSRDRMCAHMIMIVHLEDFLENWLTFLIILRTLASNHLYFEKIDVLEKMEKYTNLPQLAGLLRTSF